MNISPIRESDLARSLSNLINNAVESLDDNNGWVRVSLYRRPPFIEIKVADNGKGIPDERLKVLGQYGVSFDKSGRSGNGLGLHYASQIAQMAKGRLRIESELGSGTTVTMIMRSNYWKEHHNNHDAIS